MQINQPKHIMCRWYFWYLIVIGVMRGFPRYDIPLQTSVRFHGELRHDVLLPKLRLREYIDCFQRVGESGGTIERLRMSWESLKMGQLQVLESQGQTYPTSSLRW
jgi:hypothetical protein